MRLSKEIYLSSVKQTCKKLHLSEQELNTAVFNGVGPKSILDACAASSEEKIQVMLNSSSLLGIDIAYYYKKMKQFRVDLVDAYTLDDTVDLSCLRDEDVGWVIDMHYGVRDYAVFVWKADFPRVIGDKTYDYSITVYDDLSKECKLSFVVSGSGKLHKVYAYEHSVCKGCGKCQKFDDLMLVSRRRHDMCTVCDVVGIDYFTVTKCVTQTLTTVSTMLKKRRTHTEKVMCDRTAPSIHVARYRGNEDVMLTLQQATYQYKESHRSEYKGEHHASPCAHPRRGYYRKSRVGDHVIKNDEFVPVPKGTGTHTWVNPCIVNFTSDSVGYYKVDVTN